MPSQRPGGSEGIFRDSNRVVQMLAAYRANLKRGTETVREMILQDIRRFSDLGAWNYVEELTDVLFMFDEETTANDYPAWPSMSVASIGH
jgi:hypothetical protein